jgi:hypothetical protein
MENENKNQKVQEKPLDSFFNNSIKKQLKEDQPRAEKLLPPISE